MCWLALFLFLSVSTRDKRDEINIFVAGDPCRKEHPMLKVFATQVVVSRGYDGAAAIKFSEKGDAVRFRIGKKVYDPNAENNARWVNLAVKGFGPICERIKKMQLKDGSFVNLIGRLDEDVWEDQQTHEKKSAMVIILDDIEYAPAEVSLRITRTPMKRKDIRQHQLRPYPQITAALPATSRLAEAIPSSTKTERQQLNRAYKRRT